MITNIPSDFAAQHEQESDGQLLPKAKSGAGSRPAKPERKYQ